MRLLSRLSLALSMAASVFKATSSTDRPATWFIEALLGGSKTTSGVRVTTDSAMRVSAVWACVRIRGEDIGKLPVILYRRLSNGGRERVIDHPAAQLVRGRPNKRQTQFEFRSGMQQMLDLHGNAYAFKEINGAGQVVALWPLDPRKVTIIEAADGSLFYRYETGDPIPDYRMIHLRGFSFDGKCGVSPIHYHRESVGLALAAEQYGAAFFGNNATPSGALKVKQVLSPESAALLRADFEKKHKGALNAHNLAIFDGDMEWMATGMNNTDAQWIETRKMQLGEIARIYRMPPHKIGDLERATFTNIEHQGLEYVVDCLMSEAVRWEQVLSAALLTEQEQRSLYFEFLFDGLLRGDAKSRAEAYQLAFRTGRMSANEIRALENMAPVEGGDTYFRTADLVPLDAPYVAPTSAPKPPTGDKPQSDDPANDPATPPVDPPAPPKESDNG